MMSEIKLDEEFAGLMAPLSSDEFKLLEESIKKEGCLEPLVVWREMNILLDGYNRYRICGNKVPYKIRELNFEARDEAENWIITNQLSRRNATAELVSYLRGRRYNREKARWGGEREASSQSDNLKTHERLAEEYGVGPATIARDGAFAEAVDELREVLEDNSFKKNALVRECKLGRGDVVKLARITKKGMKNLDKDGPVLAKQIYRMVISGEADSVSAAEREVRRREERRIAKRVKLPKGIEIIQGDCKNVMAGLDKEFDLLVTDPPYNVKEIDWDKIGTRVEYLRFIRERLMLAQSLMSNKWHAFIFCSPVYMADFEMLFRGLGLKVQSKIIWHYRNLTEGRNIDNRFVSSWQPIFHLGNHILNLSSDWSDERFDVQTYAVPQTNFEKDEKFHETQKPLDLIKWLVKMGSYEGQLVLDPFAGAGTTGVACKELNRQCVMVEEKEEFVNTIKVRLAK